MLKLNNINYSAQSDSLTAKKETKQILYDISLEVNEGEIVGIVGESGAGKTTLAKILSGILIPDSGEIIYRGKVDNNFAIESSIQILFQNSIELINPFRKVEDILAEVVKKYSNKTTKDKIEELLNVVELPQTILTKFGSNLSGGERQRVALLRLLATNPRLLIIDEPFSAQDIESQLNMIKLLKGLNKNSGLTIICISHDIQIISKFTDKLIVLKDGKIIEEGPTSGIMTSPKHSYTKFLLKAKNFELSYSDFENLKEELK
ncbi:MAG: ATP-binding cassette domain-containing protein [Chlorobi bacterium]|nr:ATP-binding cassette domain-containing protein [Chlorobiota bacterium]